MLQEFEQSKRPKLTSDQPCNGSKGGNTDLEAGTEDEIISWSSPKKPPRSPICFDEPLSFIEPVVRVPRRIILGATHQREVANATTTMKCHQAAEKQHVDKENNKRKHSAIYDLPLKTVPSSSEDEDEEIMS
jgi:hypothetical protein